MGYIPLPVHLQVGKNLYLMKLLIPYHYVSLKNDLYNHQIHDLTLFYPILLVYLGILIFSLKILVEH